LFLKINCLSQILSTPSPISGDPPSPLEPFSSKPSEREDVADDDYYPNQSSLTSTYYVSDDSLHNRGKASIITNLLLISRIPSNFAIEQIIEEVKAIDILLGGPSILIDELIGRYEDNPDSYHYNKHEKRLGIVVVLYSFAEFSTTGTYNSAILPLFFFTPKSRIFPPYAGTSLRLTVQAIPSTQIFFPHPEVELATIRGIPDNSHSSSTVFGLILQDLQATLGQIESILPIFITLKTKRIIKRGKDIWIEELFLCLYVPSTPIFRQLQPLLHLRDLSIGYSSLAWKGQMARTLDHYKSSPTNLPDLVYQPIGIIFFLVLMNPSKSSSSLLKTIYHQQLPSALKSFSKRPWTLHGFR
jgi:hypothetical protein